MAQTPEDETSEIASRSIGVLVTVIAVVLAAGPFVGKVTLRSTVPPVWVPDVSRDLEVGGCPRVYGATKAGSLRESDVNRNTIGQR
jgi:hypothetical protein